MSRLISFMMEMPWKSISSEADTISVLCFIRQKATCGFQSAAGAAAVNYPGRKRGRKERRNEETAGVSFVIGVRRFRRKVTIRQDHERGSEGCQEEEDSA